jgi:hypothetical protein
MRMRAPMFSRAQYATHAAANAQYAAQRRKLAGERVSAPEIQRRFQSTEVFHVAI